MMHKRFVFTVAVLVSALAVSLAGRAVAVTITIELPANNSMFKVGEQATFRAVLSNFGDHHYEWMWWFGDIQYVEGWSYGVGERQEGDPPVTIQGPHTFAVPCHDAAAIVWVAETTDEGTQHYSAEVRFSAIQADLMSVSFTSDHHVMTDGNFYTGGGQVFPKPDWVSGERNNPISQTMGTNLAADVTLTVSPPGIAFTLDGTASHAGLQFSTHLSGQGEEVSTGQPQTVQTMAAEPLQSRIHRLQMSIPWVLAVDGLGEVQIGSSGEHDIFVTYGQPTGDGTEARKPNRNRVHWVTSTCALLTDPYGCVDSIFTQADQRFAPGSPQLPQIWFLFSGETTGECHDIARFCEAASQMLGLPGDLEVRWGYPDTDRQCFEGDTHSLNRRRRLDVSGHPPPEETTHDEICHPSDVDGAREWLIYEDASPLHLPNFHEGCFRYTHDQGTRYYAPGAGAYSSIGDVMNAVVWRTAWIYWTGPNFAAPCKDPGPYPEAVW